jgi:hypothetical protein
MHAPFKRQVERKVAPGERLFPFRLPKFESYQPGILNSPAAMLFTLAPPQCHARNRCGCCTLATPQLPRELSLLRRFGQIGRNSPAIRADFDPNGFSSSSPTTPATQSVSPMCRTRQARPGSCHQPQARAGHGRSGRCSEQCWRNIEPAPNMLSRRTDDLAMSSHPSAISRTTARRSLERANEAPADADAAIETAAVRRG